MNFYQDTNGVYCIKDDGTKAVSEWITYDFEVDGLLEYYYFDWDGYLLTDTYTPDGYYVNYMGQWTENGIIQHKMSPFVQPGFSPPVYYSPDTSDTYNQNNNIKETIETTQQQNNQIYRTHSSQSGGSAIMFILIFILFLISVISNLFKRSDYKDSYRNNKKQDSIWYTGNVGKEHRKKSEYELKTETDLIGERGEIKAEYCLSFLDDKIYKILKNVKFKNKNFMSTEIDFICMTDKCAFVIEIKNWYGDIYGEIEDENWYSRVNYMTVNTQRNPIKQNEGHVSRFKRELQKINISMPIYSVVAFDERGIFRSKPTFDKYTHIVNILKLEELIQSIYSQQNGRSINVNYVYAHFKQYAAK